MLQMQLWVFQLVCCVLCLLQLAKSAPDRQFSFGTIEGVNITSLTGEKDVYAYYGIPYAQPPVGALRFLPPEPYNNTDSSKVISHDTFRNSCIQFPVTETPMDEDCLHLNIFVPSSLDANLHCHVMVYIHGGGHVTGDARDALPTDLVAEHDVIVVTINYRLGFLGFLSSADAAAPGNNGLRDQVMAIQWVKDNIWKFLGNSSDITVFGHGSGASSASLLSLSPVSKGLFQKVIMMSGTAIAPWALVSKERSIENFKHLATRLGCYPWYCSHLCFDFDLHYRVLGCFRTKSALDFDPFPLMDNIPGNGLFLLGSFENLYAGPTCDGIFLPNTPEMLLKNVTYLEENGISSRQYISGTTNQEALHDVTTAMEGHADKYLTSTNMRMLAMDAAKFLYPTCTSPQIVNLIDFLYSYPREEGPDPKLLDYVDLVTDSLYTYPSVEFLSQLSATSPDTDIYMYLFNYNPDIKQNETEFHNETIGTTHTYDLLYFFDKIVSVNDTAGYIDLNTTGTQKMMECYRGTLAAFAKTGNPSLPNAEWPRFDEVDSRYFSMEPEPKARQRIFPKRMSLWQDYLPIVVENLPDCD